MFTDEHYNMLTLYMFITMIHFVLMYLVILLSYLMKYTLRNFIQYLDVLKAIIVFEINCLELSTARSILARKYNIRGSKIIIYNTFRKHVT